MLPVKSGTILVPTAPIDKFAVVACDQFSSYPEYWENIQELTRDCPSAYKLIVPDIYLDSAPKMQSKIAATARAYLADGVFKKVNAPVLTVRKTAYGRTRTGLMLLLDLNAYDYKKGVKPPVRASERTIEKRVAARVPLRCALPIEIPHALILIDDINNSLMKAAQNVLGEKLYSGELNGDGGSIEGYALTDEKSVINALKAVYDSTRAKYGEDLFAIVGDGNHSIATAKRCYELNPTEANRYTLVEIESVHDSGLVCEPINRLVYTKSADELIGCFKGLRGEATAQIYSGHSSPVTVNVPQSFVECVSQVDKVLEDFALSHDGAPIEYVHGDAALINDNAVGIKMPALKRTELFSQVVKYGVLPKKSFSLGEGSEKRYYIEAREIDPKT